MKLQNFRLTEIIGKSPINFRFRAKVDVVTGIFRKKTETKDIYKSYIGSWYFVDSGELLPTIEIDNLERAYKAKHGKELEHIKINETLPTNAPSLRPMGDSQ